ncbi:peptidoglycan bridge formation glycyltransferase FemA/FemB family protein [Candidatus Saccharibacteria bacterium]|nr:peptidoglycan bridge formation glycyltransferase FemA/FemB family protein [Candidatus Saccharibacteria bacterium]
MRIPITQSKLWQKLQEDLGETSFYEKKGNYEYLAILKTTPVGNYLYLPYGPIYVDKEGFNDAYNSLKALAAKHGAIFIRVEPLDPDFAKYAPKNTKKSTDLNPKETWILGLKGTDDELKQKLPSRLLRYHRNAEKNGLTIETSHDPEDVKHLIALQKALADKKGINIFSEKYLSTELAQPFSTLYIVKYQNPETNQQEIVAAGLVFDDAVVRYNLQGAQSEQGRRLHATGILTIQLILDAKAKSLETFDFWGIAPEGAPDNHPWAGFTNFKKTFAGEEEDHAGTYDIILKPSKYKLYQTTRKINRLLRRA